MIRSAGSQDIAGIQYLLGLGDGAAAWTHAQVADAIARAAGHSYLFLVECAPPDGTQVTSNSEPASACPSHPVAQQGPLPAENLAGVVAASILAGDYEIENLIVAPAYRSSGHGRLLLQAVIEHARNNNAR